MSILIIDDQERDFRLLEGMLSPHGYELISAPTGERALELLWEEDVDLVLLDIMMPGISGFEILKKIRKDDRLRTMPVIIITGLVERENKIRGLQEGADDYILKPFDAQELLARVNTQMRLVMLRKQMIQELIRSNKALEQFAFVAAHDLQSPLQTISLSFEILQAQYSDSLDENGKKYIGTGLTGVRRIHDLVNGLLAYSRLDRSGKTLEAINGHEAYEAALENLSIVIKEKGASVICPQPLPTITGDKVLMMQLFQNLIGNAMKYCDEKPTVHVGVKKEDKGWVFSIKDNGIGIAPEAHDKVFDLFVRLNSKGKYPGSGIGLATCKRILEHHGGDIWVKSEPGKGSTFYFTIPDKLEEKPVTA